MSKYDIFKLNLNNQNFGEHFLYIKKGDKSYERKCDWDKNIYVLNNIGSNQPYLADAKKVGEIIKLYFKFLTTWMNIFSPVLAFYVAYIW